MTAAMLSHSAVAHIELEAAKSLQLWEKGIVQCLYDLGGLPQSSPTDAATDHCHGIGKPIKGLIINITAPQSSVSKC